MAPNDLYSSLLDALLELAWQQWTAIGVAGTRASRGVLVDPEALLLATLQVARTDPRLFDEALYWVVHNAPQVDIARLKRLARNGTSHQRRLLGVTAQIAGLHGAGPTMRRLPDEQFIARESKSRFGEEALFMTAEGQPLLMPGQETDPLFGEAGYLRGPLDLRAMSRRPDTALPACLRFRARALVGIGPRAEVLTYLWTHEWAHGREIASRSAYGQASVADYLSTFAGAGWAERRVDGRRTLYRLGLALRDAAGGVPLYVDWAAVWPALVALLEHLRPRDMREDARWVGLYGALQQHEAALRAEGFGVEIGDVKRWVHDGPEVLERAVVGVVARTRELATAER